MRRRMNRGVTYAILFLDLLRGGWKLPTDPRVFYWVGRRLEEIDDELVTFAMDHDMTIRKNFGGQVCRVLYRGRNPRRVIEVRHFGHWTEMSKESEPIFTVRALVIWRSREGVLMVKEAAVIDSTSFAGLRESLGEALQRGIGLLQKWKIPYETDSLESTNGWACDIGWTEAWRKDWPRFAERWARETHEQRSADESMAADCARTAEETADRKRLR